MIGSEYLWGNPSREQEYPRLPGELSVFPEAVWNRQSPFGHCPACGSIGVEEDPGSECEIALFRCSDEYCRTKISLEDGGFQMVETNWHEEKPILWRLQEETGVSWNWEHFPEDFCTIHNLV